MVHYESDGVFEASLEDVWQILEEHGDPVKVREHHPSLLDFKILEATDEYMIAEETFEGPDGPIVLPSKLIFDPPESWSAEVVDGPFEGATYTHTYEAISDTRTRVELVGEFPVPEGMDEAGVLSAVDELFTTGFHEDQRALKRL